MARNQERAMLLLNRYWAARKDGGTGEKDKRPYLASECNDLKKAEKWRVEIIREIAKKVAQIQNPGLGEFRIRDLNDDINKSLREKGHWEDRILELGGPNYRRFGPKMLDREGKEVPGSRGYKYFGAARDLPGVRELFQQEPPKPVRKTRGELAKHVDADYYGYRDDDDGVLASIEREVEEHARAAAIAQWKEKKELGQVEEAEETDIYSTGPPPDSVGGGDDEEQQEVESSEVAGQVPFLSHVEVPSQQEVEDMLVSRKKQELLEKYASEALQQQSQDAKTLLGLQ